MSEPVNGSAPTEPQDAPAFPYVRNVMPSSGGMVEFLYCHPTGAFAGQLLFRAQTPQALAAIAEDLLCFARDAVEKAAVPPKSGLVTASADVLGKLRRRQ